jgi:hypothetical protein
LIDTIADTAPHSGIEKVFLKGNSMKKYLWFYHVILLFFLISATVCQAESDGYGYPYSNPYEPTILQTPVDLKAPLPPPINVKELEMTVFPDRKIPEVFWYNEKLYYSLAAQKQKSPVMFVLAGTGARYDSPKAQVMRNAFYAAGFHVICLSSSTHPNIFVTASSAAAPGDIRSDSLYRCRIMTLVWEKAKAKIDASDFYLSGYSLGGAQAAFIAVDLNHDFFYHAFGKVLPSEAEKKAVNGSVSDITNPDRRLSMNWSGVSIWIYAKLKLQNESII